MLSRTIGAPLLFARSRLPTLEWRALLRGAKKSLIVALHRGLLVSGAAAITALCMMYFKPNLADRLKALSPFSETAIVQTPAVSAPALANLLDMQAKPVENTELSATESFTEDDLKSVGTPHEQQLVTNWLSRRYHIANEAANMLVSASYLTARDTKLDPLLILAVMCIESGLNPFAESAMGAQGLMQVMSKLHHEKFKELGGVKAALNPVANIKVGSLILKDYVTRGGSVEAGLKLYVGAAAFDNDAGYGAKVLAEYHRLKDVAGGKNVPTVAAPIATTALKQHSQDGGTENQPAVHPEPDSASIDGVTKGDSSGQSAIL